MSRPGVEPCYPGEGTRTGYGAVSGRMVGAALALALTASSSAQAQLSAFERGNPNYHWSTDMTPITVYQTQCEEGSAIWERCHVAPALPGWAAQCAAYRRASTGGSPRDECATRWQSKFEVPRAYVHFASTETRDARTFWDRLRGVPAQGEWPENLRGQVKLHMHCTDETGCIPRPLASRGEAVFAEATAAGRAARKGREPIPGAFVPETPNDFARLNMTYVNVAAVNVEEVKKNVMRVNENYIPQSEGMVMEGFQLYHQVTHTGRTSVRRWVSEERGHNLTDIRCIGEIKPLWFCRYSSFIESKSNWIGPGDQDGFAIISTFVIPQTLGGLDGVNRRVDDIRDALCTFLDCADNEGEAR